jgi:hypothetical protein
MDALEIVPVDEVADPRPGIGQFEERAGLEALVPERVSEPLDLAQRLEMPRRRHDPADAALCELLVEGALAARLTYCAPLSVRTSSCGL